MRRRKLGLPEELSEEEKAEDERRKAERAVQNCAHKLVAKPVGRITAMRDILTTMKKSSDAVRTVEPLSISTPSARKTVSIEALLVLLRPSYDTGVVGYAYASSARHDVQES